MPELPEVETVRKTLIQLVKNKKIQDVIIYWPKIIKKPLEIEQFQDALKGQTIVDVGRRGKFLKFYLDDYVLVSHLRMEGRYGLHNNNEEFDKHTHVIFQFDDGTELRYRDVRKFGTMHLFKKGEEEDELPLSQLGPEPFSNLFTVNYLKEKLSRTNRKIKIALLDQTLVVGLGNIYVDEALFRAGIHPERIAKDLTGEEYTALHGEIIRTLEEAIESGGSTIRSYVNSQGEIGLFQLKIFVYGRTNEPCKKCGTILTKTVVGGRGTHYCSTCQK
ncbi:DNA-formamidopyrimidine glycosylase [Metabacillus fastidiosus]|uniref:DNA-formamidopyrimidine glycosylase n=1 Tax=Metabacillus fastidiosus TaxID=1458 RepID=UPI000826BF06|nr:DNA-formamidopyrimidine glycosylase [Metabacillus fastidiosus]MED4453250.1 DNA-formamidopyrimidine glycosylase [Metabacillus fastidiosus]MED4464099.1 DNA-formamidopyrimidine glycosylase [Metabacillus fastidiosus]